MSIRSYPVSTTCLSGGQRFTISCKRSSSTKSIAWFRFRQHSGCVLRNIGDRRPLSRALVVLVCTRNGRDSERPFGADEWRQGGRNRVVFVEVLIIFYTSTLMSSPSTTTL